MNHNRTSLKGVKQWIMYGTTTGIIKGILGVQTMVSYNMGWRKTSYLILTDDNLRLWELKGLGLMGM